ncbi:MAG: PQQ-binding-like beta-propeller repeat protein [Verrucomicrobiota bacterium]
MKSVPLLALALLGAAVAARADDWPMLGGRPDRNMVSPEKNLPIDWHPGGKAPRKNVKWSAPLGHVTFGSPVIAAGRVFIGTDSDDPDLNKKSGILKCFSERDGSLLWKAVHEKLPNAGEDDGTVGICCTPCVVGDRVYYVSNRAELVCRAVSDGKVQWSLDLRATLGISPNQASASSPLVVDDLVFVVTGQGTDYKTGKIKNPAAPSFVAVDRHTGKVAWQDASPGNKILTGQWGSPAYGVVEGQPQIAFPGGDGWLYSFEPKTGKLLWKFNAKAHEKPSASGEPETTFNLVAAPVFSGDRILFAIGEPEAGSGPGALRAVDARKRGDITKTGELWRLGGNDFNDSISTVALHGGLVFAADTAGFLSCLDADTGNRLWSHDVKANVWGSPLVSIFAATREKKLLATVTTLPEVAHGTPVAANGTLYIVGQKTLYALEAK